MKKDRSRPLVHVKGEHFWAILLGHLILNQGRFRGRQVGDIQTCDTKTERHYMNLDSVSLNFLVCWAKNLFYTFKA